LPTSSLQSLFVPLVVLLCFFFFFSSSAFVYFSVLLFAAATVGLSSLAFRVKEIADST
jgi:hypothetical protein